MDERDGHDTQEKQQAVIDSIQLPTDMTINTRSDSKERRLNNMDHGLRTDDDRESTMSDELDREPEMPEPAAKSAIRAAIFAKWIIEMYDNLQKKVRTSHGKADMEPSMQELLSQQESVKITDPRDYQTELFERAKKQNTIAVLPTGSGKTLIAVLLLRHILDNEVERRAASVSMSGAVMPKYAFFLVTTTTLVFQQYAVLECNLDHKIHKLYGTMNNSLWHKKTWDGIFKDTMVIVCTADILYQCLFHSYIDIGKINIIIFDEAHHAKQNAAYAKIMQDFYYKWEATTDRPRIFGMTASPVDTKDTDIRQAAGGLEKLVDSNIATIELADEYKSHAKESVCYYDKLRDPFETHLWQELHKKFGHLRDAQRLFNTAKALTANVGPWAADFFWTFAFREEAARNMAKRAEKMEEAAFVRVEDIDRTLKVLDEAGKYIHDYNLKKAPDLNHQDMSSKALVLHNLLTSHYDSPTTGRCIVFVQTRAAAKLLYHIFKTLNNEHLKVGILTGAGRDESGDESQSFRKQVETLLAFKKGALNCLFATSVAEEGLDIPSCNLVIRFDLYNSMIGYVQSRGRARHKNSKFYHMVERDNHSHHENVVQARRGAKEMMNWCSNLPEDRILKGIDADLPAEWVDELIDPESKATLNSHNALVILASFVASVQIPAHLENTSSSKPQYIITGSPNAWLCEVILPAHCMLERAMGKVKTRKSLAKRSAAFEMCKQLRQKSYLDKHFLLKEEMRKIGPAMRNARIGIRSTSLTAYDCILKPTSWLKHEQPLPMHVYMTVIDVTSPLDRSHQPLGILSRCQLPEFPKFPIYLTGGESRTVQVHTEATALPCAVSFLQKAATFTLIVLQDVFKKEFEDDIAAMPYWLVPITQCPMGDVKYQIDFLTLDTVTKSGVNDWSAEMSDDVLKDRFLVDKWSARRLFSIEVDHTKRPDDPVPDGVARTKFSGSILEYSNSLWKRARGQDSQAWDHDQPVMKASQISFWQDMLSPPQDRHQDQEKQVWVCPQFFKISSLPTTVVATALMFPAIIHRLEDYMIALEAAQLVGINLDASIALEALTKNTDNSENDDGQEIISFRGGMGANYERLEFLGDCFLKLATSIAVYVTKPHDNEFQFHVARMLMLCNQTLFDQAIKLKLHEYVRSRAFSRRTWYPPRMKLLKGTGATESQQPASALRGEHHLNDKSIADVCESLIGAAFYQNNRPGDWAPEQWDAAVKAVTTFVSSEDHKMLKWQDYIDAYVIPDYLLMTARARDVDLAVKVEKEHDYHFKNPRLVSCAFKHSSEPASEDKLPSYQRLEFLGDALLDLACVSSLYYRYADKDPQWLTEHKMAIASNQFLSALCVKIGFHRHLRPWSETVRSQITEWALEISETERTAGEGEVNYWMTVSSPPKCLADIVEAYIGAIFVDSGFDFRVVQRFYDVHIAPFFVDMSLYDTFANNHPVTRLINKLGVELGCKDFALMAQDVPEDLPGAKPRVVAALMIHDKIVAWEVRESGGYAKVAASKTAYSMLDGLFPIDYRRLYACDCQHEINDPQD